MKSKEFDIQQNSRGALTSLKMNHDQTGMNWLIDPKYLEQVGYQDAEKLFGEFTLTIANKTYNSIDYTPNVMNTTTKSKVVYQIASVTITLQYQLEQDYLNWHIEAINETEEALQIDNFGLWASFAYVMFRDNDVQRNANQSTAAFPSISPNYTKLALVRRDNTAPNLGLFQTQGQMRSIGTYNEYSNRFFENVSPSLDGMLFHQLILAGGYPKGNGPHNDWIYSQAPVVIAPHATVAWAFKLKAFADKNDFYAVGAEFNHPEIQFLPLLTAGHNQIINLKIGAGKTVTDVEEVYQLQDQLVRRSLLNQLTDEQQLIYPVVGLGEHQVIFRFSDKTEDMIVFNVMSTIKNVMRDRTDYISEQSYSGATGKVPYSFGPVSNQGESLGKMTFMIQECLLDPQITNRLTKIRQVEKSAVEYIIPKWFIGGDFKRPAKLYGDFYRVMDLEYIAHLFYLLAQCSDTELVLNSPQTYLSWAAQIFDVRVNPDLHEDERGKAEAQMMGQYFLYIEDLLKALKANHLDQEYSEIANSWQKVTKRIANESPSLASAVTEHFFDNAGFGPAAGALAVSGHPDEAVIYGNLLKANIGFSNDFRAQSPDRWWEALSYMVHALWGGVTAASALIAGRALWDAELVEAAYRGTVAVLYMYDTNATTTNRLLKPGEAASTYSIAGPNLNRPDLSRNRFGQSVFSTDGGIFTRLFPDGYTGEDDWDMGEELVAYLNGFGQETYIYQDNNVLKVINGAIETAPDGTLIIESFAPYLKQYIDLTKHEVIATTETKVRYNNGIIVD